MITRQLEQLGDIVRAVGVFTTLANMNADSARSSLACLMPEYKAVTEKHARRQRKAADRLAKYGAKLCDKIAGELREARQ